MAGPRRNRSADVQVDDVPKKHRKVSDDDAADDAEDPAEEAEVAEEEEEEEEEDEDPIELLKAQGVSEDVAKRMLEKADGDLDAAVMLIVEHQELEKEEKDLAKVMEESLQEAEADPKTSGPRRGAKALSPCRVLPGLFLPGTSRRRCGGCTVLFGCEGGRHRHT